MDLTNMQKQALAARDAHLALLDLKRLVDRAARTARAAELEAVSMAVRPKSGREIPASFSGAMEDLRTLDFEPTMSQAREKLRTALLWRPTDAKPGE